MKNDSTLVPWPSDLLDRFVASAGNLSVDRLAQSLTHRPAENYLGLLTIATLLFYRAERGNNPKVNDVWDALVYCTTCCSVGYSDIFARTSVGKAVGSLLMTIGPAMAAKALDGRDARTAEAMHREILEKLESLVS